MNGGSDRIIVIGGGAAGLAAATRLTAHGRRVLLLEARDRLGGRVWTEPRPDGNVVELGAEFVHGRPPEIFTLAGENNLELKEFEGESWCHEASRPAPCDRHLEKVFSTIEGLARRTTEDLSFSELIARCGSSISEEERAWMSGFVEGFHAADVSRISSNSVLQDMKAEEEIGGETAFRFPAGYQSLVTALVRSCVPACFELRVGHSVMEVNWSRGKVAVSGISDAGRFEFSGRAAIITVPLGVLKAPPGESGAIRFSPELSEKQRALSRMEMGAAFRVTIRFKRRFWSDREAGMDELGFLFSRQPMFPTWWTSPQSGNAALTGWFAGPRAWEICGSSGDAIFEFALTSLAAIFTMDGDRLSDLVEDYQFHNWQADPYSRGAYSYLLVNGAGAQKILAEPVEHTLFFAGEATEMTGHRATVHGAMATGYRAAEEVLHAIKGAETASDSDSRLLNGAELFNQENFFEAHEVWEDCWREASGERRTVLQGLVQAAAAFHHLQKGNRTGALSLLEKAGRRLSDKAVRLPLDLQALRTAVETWTSALRTGAADPSFPRL